MSLGELSGPYVLSQESSQGEAEADLTQRRCNVAPGAEVRRRQPRSWERRGKESLLEPLAGLPPCWLLDFSLPAPRAVRECLLF